ncbi:MAG: methyl-accepting chemotaxis protein, partial [Halobacteriaceae archaeon]
MAADQLLSNILDGLEMAAFVVDSKGVVTHVNGESGNLFQTHSEELLGRHVRDIYPSDFKRELLVEVLDSGEPIKGVEDEFESSGEKRYVRRNGVPFEDDNGNTIGGMELVSDITTERRERQRNQLIEEYQEDVLNDLGSKLDRLAEGDLTIDPTVDEPPADFDAIQSVYEEFIQMNDSLVQAVDNIRETIQELTDIADDVSKTSDNLSASSEEVTSSIEQIGASSQQIAEGSETLAEQAETANQNLDTLSASVEEITATAQEMDAQSEQAEELASEGVEEISRAVQQIRDAVDAASQIEDDISTLEQRMEAVEEITDVISDIADQTNLLALNANIEAARA